MGSQVGLWGTILLGGVAGWALLLSPGEAAAAEVPALVNAGTAGVTIAQTPGGEGFAILHVNPTGGNDIQGTGSQMQPLKTITHALRIAQPNTLILLAGGVYSTTSGETFPLQLRPGVTVQGAAGPNTADVVIQGGGRYVSPSQGLQNVALLGADNAGLANVTVSNPHPIGIGVWIESGSPILLENAFFRNGAIGIYIAGSGAPVIRSNYFSENGEAGLIINGPSSAQVQSNVFENTGTGISVAPEATPEITDNRITRNRDGLVLHANARPTLHNNQISQNRRNSILDYADWSTPTGGTTQASQPPPPVLSPGAAASAVTAVPPPAEPPAIATPNQPDSAPELTATLPAPPPPAADVSPVSDSIEESPLDSPSAETATADAAETAALPRPAPPALSALGNSLSADLQATVPVLETAAVAVVPAVPIASSLSKVDLTPTVQATAGLATEIAAAPPQAEATPAIAVFDPETPEAAEPVALAAPLAPSARDRSAQGRSVPNETPEAIEIPIIPPPVETVAAPAALPQTPQATPDPAAEVVELPTTLDLPELPPLVANSTPADIARIIVPSDEIPMGSGGDLPDLFTAGAATGLPTEGPPPPPSLASSLGLNYKILVAAADPTTQAQVRQQIPDAFRVRLNDRTFMQVGAYPTLEEAQARAAELNRQGLQTQIEHIP